MATKVWWALDRHQVSWHFSGLLPVYYLYQSADITTTRKSLSFLQEHDRFDLLTVHIPLAAKHWNIIWHNRPKISDRNNTLEKRLIIIPNRNSIRSYCHSSFSSAVDIVLYTAIYIAFLTAGRDDSRVVKTLARRSEGSGFKPPLVQQGWLSLVLPRWRERNE